jgi:hypothetical protein
MTLAQETVINGIHNEIKGTQPYADPDEVYDANITKINERIEQLGIMILEQTGRLDFYTLALQDRDLELTRLRTDNGFMAERLRLIKEELRMATEQLAIWKKIAKRETEGTQF